MFRTSCKSLRFSTAVSRISLSRSRMAKVSLFANARHMCIYRSTVFTMFVLTVDISSCVLVTLI